jgi:DNA (cytosine-5)-methyltransferase 1
MKPRLLDLFCGAGGAAMGYHRAGFDILGVDIQPQPNYPFRFMQGDAVTVLENWWIQQEVGAFDAIHASPPCQAHTSMQSVAKNGHAHPDMIAPVRELLQHTGLPYVIENVVGAPLDDPITLCGSSFGLGVIRPDTGRWHDLRWHRLFETSWLIGMTPPCGHAGRKAVGLYGDHLHWGRRATDGELSGPNALRLGGIAMQIEWMNWPELVQAIPPAYTEWVGEALLAEIDALAAVHQEKP